MCLSSHFPLSLTLVTGLLVCMGCSSGENEPVMHSDWEEGLEAANQAQAEVYSKPLKPTEFTAMETKLLVDAPEGIEIKDLFDIQIDYPYVISIKVIEQVDLATAKSDVMAKEGFKKIVTDEPDRLVVLVDSYGTEEYQFWINKTLGEVEFTFTNEGRGWTPSTEFQLEWALKMADSIRLNDKSTVGAHGLAM